MKIIEDLTGTTAYHMGTDTRGAIKFLLENLNINQTDYLSLYFAMNTSVSKLYRLFRKYNLLNTNSVVYREISNGLVDSKKQQICWFKET